MGKRDRSAKAGSSSAVSQIIPSLYLGPCSAASSKALLAAKRVTHVLSVGARPETVVEGVTYTHVPLNDSPSSSIDSACQKAYTDIDNALKSRKNTGKILIHCSAGISRSPTIVAAYLMHHYRMTLMQALKQIVEARPQVCPNPGFIQQLKDLEKGMRGTESTLGVDELPKKEKDRLALFAKVTPWSAS